VLALAHVRAIRIDYNHRLAGVLLQAAETCYLACSVHLAISTIASDELPNEWIATMFLFLSIVSWSFLTANSFLYRCTGPVIENSGAPRRKYAATCLKITWVLCYRLARYRKLSWPRLLLFCMPDQPSCCDMREVWQFSGVTKSRNWMTVGRASCRAPAAEPDSRSYSCMTSTMMTMMMWTPVIGWRVNDVTSYERQTTQWLSDILLAGVTLQKFNWLENEWQKAS